MALPRSGSGIFYADTYFGPYKMPDNSYYIIKIEGGAISDNVAVVKTSDMDTGSLDVINTHYPSGNASGSLSWIYNVEDAVVDGNLIHVVISHTTNSTFLFSTFNVSSNSWTTGYGPWTVIGNSNEIGISFDYPAGIASIVPRPNEEIIVSYNGNRETVMGSQYKRVNYSRRSGGTWTTNQVLLGAATTVSYSLISSALGANNRVHTIFNDRTNNQIGQRTLFDTTLQTASTQITFTNLLSGGTNASWGQAVTSNANTKICTTVYNYDPSSGDARKFFTVSFDSANTPTLSSTFVTNIYSIYTDTRAILRVPIWVDEGDPTGNNLYSICVPEGNGQAIVLFKSTDNGINWSNNSVIQVAPIEIDPTYSLSQVYSRKTKLFTKGSKTVIPYYYIGSYFIQFFGNFEIGFYNEYTLRGGVTPFSYGYIIS